MTKYDMINDMQQKMEALADAKGAFRCGLIWDITRTMSQLLDTLKSEDEVKKQMKGAICDANDHHQHG